MGAVRRLKGPFRSLQRFFYKREIRRIRREMGDRIHRETEGRVQAGPLAGMTVLRREVWGDNMTAKLLGTYEQELRQPVRRLVRERRYDRVVVVGCAEGYWAVGLALLLPHARVRAFEDDAGAREIAAANARGNGVEERLEIRGHCGRSELREALDEAGEPDGLVGPGGREERGGRGRALCLVDVEGEEVELLDPDAVPGLLSADLVVECHDRWDGSIRPRLIERFRPSHEVEIVEREGRAPAKFESLRRHPDLEAYLAILEPRSRSAGWLVLRAKRPGG